MKILTVIHAFGDYRRGDRITDAAEVEGVLAGENASHVVATEVADPPSQKKAMDPATAG